MREMTNQGFSDVRAGFQKQPLVPCIGDVRRFGAFGPAYEVTDITAAGNLVIMVVESGECLEYTLADFLADPIAVTIP